MDKGSGGADDAARLAGPKRLCRGVEVFAGLGLYEGEYLAALGDDVDLADG